MYRSGASHAAPELPRPLTDGRYDAQSGAVQFRVGPAEGAAVGKGAAAASSAGVNNVKAGAKAGVSTTQQGKGMGSAGGANLQQPHQQGEEALSFSGSLDLAAGSLAGTWSDEGRTPPTLGRFSMRLLLRKPL
jgi:hypothetical protein